nr:unnamed protein product [Digitaria exilis]
MVAVTMTGCWAALEVQRRREIEVVLRCRSGADAARGGRREVVEGGDEGAAKQFVGLDSAHTARPLPALPLLLAPAGSGG